MGVKIKRNYYISGSAKYKILFAIFILGIFIFNINSLKGKTLSSNEHNNVFEINTEEHGTSSDNGKPLAYGMLRTFKDINFIQSSGFKEVPIKIDKDMKLALVKGTLPEDKTFSEPTIYIDGIIAERFEVFIGNVMIYSEESKSIDWRGNKGTFNIIIPVPKGDYQGKDLIINLYAGNNNELAFHKSENTKAIVIGENRDIVGNIFHENMDRFILNCLFITIALIFMLVSILFENEEKTIIKSLGIFLIFSGISGITGANNVNILFFDKPFLWQSLNKISIWTIPAAFAYFFEQVFGCGYKGIIRKLRKVLIGFVIISVSISAAGIIFRIGLSNISDIIDNLFNFLVIVEMGILFIPLIAITIKGNEEAKIFTAGSLIYGGFIIYGVKTGRYINEWGLLCFIITLVILLYTRFLQMRSNLASYSKELEGKNHALQIMWDEISSSKNEIEKLNKNLEERVVERTEQLETTNGELKKALDTLKETQSQLVQSEKMVALGSLVAGVSHEINTPVGVSVTAASHLEEKTIEFTSSYKAGTMKKSDLEKYLKVSNEASAVILSNLKRASELIRSFKQVAVDQSNEERRTFKIKEYIDQVLMSLRPKLKKTKHEVIINCDESLQIYSFAGAFSQVITNLIMNSLIHGFNENDEGHIVFDINMEEDNIIFKYSDDGKGISEDIISKIFDPFFTTKRGNGGTGLGLNIVYNIIVQNFGGTIECKSKEGHGTTFTIKFPIDTND